MTRTVITLGLAAIALSLNACDKAENGNQAATGQPGAAKEAAGDKTIAAGINQNSRFFQAAKSAGLDATLAGPGPYTVLVPDDAAFGKLPKETTDSWAKPESRAQLTGVLTNHILPGTILAADVGKAIDAGGGKALIATMGGGTLTATREGGAIVFADTAGTRATVSAADQQRSNGVVHQIDAVLMPTQ